MLSSVVRMTQIGRPLPLSTTCSSPTLHSGLPIRSRDHRSSEVAVLTPSRTNLPRRFARSAVWPKAKTSQ